MRGVASAYAILGLEPGADPASIDRAYRALIKVHHPDREGGDAIRAAEINRAYRELRGRPAPVDAFSFDDHGFARRRGTGWIALVAVSALVLAGLAIATGPGDAFVRELVGAPPRPGVTRPPRSVGKDVMEQPINRSRIDEAIHGAVSIFGSKDATALLTASRDCHRRLRAEPSVDQLDRCAAFDDAVVELQDMDPTWDGGPFSQPAVTRRQWAAASTLSNDYLAVDSRLDRIRLQVELALAPREAAPQD